MFGIASKMLFGALCSFVVGTPYDVIRLTPEDRAHPVVQKKLKAFEASFTYPFSDTENFRIEHGKDGDYFSFFKRLGEVSYYVVMNNEDRVVKKMVNGVSTDVELRAGEIAGAVCLVLRTMKTLSGEYKNYWYICDLKVAEKYQGEHIATMITQEIGLGRFLKCSRGYAICMNPPQGEPKAASIFKKHSPIAGIQTRTLNLYTLTADQMEAELLAKIYEILEKYRADQTQSHDPITSIMWVQDLKTSPNGGGNLLYDKRIFYVDGNGEPANFLCQNFLGGLRSLSTRGMKDYGIFNQQDKGSSRPWQLYHLANLNVKYYDGQVFPKNQMSVTKEELREHNGADAMYMISAVEGTPLDDEFKAALGKPSSTAQIVSRGMEDVDFNCLTTDQI